MRPGLVHHSDRGVQYASGDYTGLLKENGIEISMSRKGNPWDNAACESFMKTLKYEEVYRTEYRNLADARAADRRVPGEGVQRKAAALGAGLRVTPTEFERQQPWPLADAAGMSFLRHGEIYRSDVGPLRTPGRDSRLPLVGARAPVKDRDGRTRACSSSR